MYAKIISLLCLLALTSIQEIATAKESNKRIELCTSSNQINLNPFRILSRQDYGYLSLLAPPIIAKQSATDAVIEGWTFTDNGTALLAKIRKGMSWKDGTEVTSRDVAVSIALQLPYREIGEKIKISGTSENQYSRPNLVIPKGVTIIDRSTFKLSLTSEIENTQGVFREALTEGSRGNKFIIVRYAEKVLEGELEEVEILSRYPIYLENGKTILRAAKKEIFLNSALNCNHPQLADSFKFIKLFKEEYTFSEANNRQALVAIIPQKNKLVDSIERQKLANWLRGTISKIAEQEGLDIPSAHFLRNEPGSGTNVSWSIVDSTLPASMPKILNVFIFSENTRTNIFGKAIEKSVRATGRTVKWLTSIEELHKADLALSPTKIRQGRQIWFQDISTSTAIARFLQGHTKTLEALKVMTAKSSATVPTDNTTLRNFEESVFIEQSIVPLSRFNLKLFSSKSSPFVLTWTGEDDWVLKER